MNKYFGYFESVGDIVCHYPESQLKDDEVVAASYFDEDYSGFAYIFFVRDGRLYEQYESHCSCHGLCNWCPDEISWDQLTFRKWDLDCVSQGFVDAMNEVVRQHCPRA